MEEEFEGLGSRVVLVDNEIFVPYEYQKEEELESKVSKLAEFVFGKETIYFDIKRRMVSRAKKINVTDGILLQLKKGQSKLWIVEFELSSHDLYSHVQPQIMGFIRSLRNPETIRDIQHGLYDEIRADKGKDKTIREFLGSQTETFLFLDQVLNRKKGIVIVIDEVTPQLDEIRDDLERYGEVKVLEFKTYKKGEEEIYDFTPFMAEKEVMEAPRRREREYPEYMKSWEARLKWVNDSTRELVNDLTQRIESELSGTSHSPKGRWHYFYKSRTPRHRSLFAVLLITKRKVNIRLRVDPSVFEDRNQVTKRYKGWFFRTRGEERGFSIKKPDQLNYALELIKQAYEHA